MSEELKEYRQFLIDTRIKLNESYDKLIITLSGGALALSITFLKDVVGSKGIDHPQFLLISWALFVCSLSSILCSILFGLSAYKKALKQVDNETILIEKAGGKSSSLSAVMHWLAAICLMFGLVFISLFAYYNIGDENGRREKTTTAPATTTAKTASASTTNR